MKKINLLFGTIFGGVGIVMIIATIFATVNTFEFMETAIEIPAVITDIETYTSYDSDGDRTTNYNVYVSYNYEGQNYEVELSEYSSSMKEGKTIELLIDPNCPTDAKYSKMIWFMPLIFAVFGLVFGGVGTGFIVNLVKQMLMKTKVMREGQQVTAVITEIGVQYNVSINGVHPLYLICEYENANGKYQFKSESNMDFYDGLIGKYITVYFIDRKNYYVDIKSLEEY